MKKLKKRLSILTVFISILAIGCSSDSNIESSIDSKPDGSKRPTTAPKISGFSVPVKIVGDAPFALTAPTSNSSGAFTYTSSNTAVATIVGNVVTIVGAGTSVIKATQAASGSFSTGEISADFVVLSSAPTPPFGLRYLYVSTTGNDANDGSINLPFLTINKAAQVAIAGDVVIIKSGTYSPTSSIVVANSGTSSAPITFFAEIKDAVIIDGNNSTTPNATDRQGLFTILGTTTTYKSWIVIDGLRVIKSKWAGIYSRYSDNVIVKNCSTNDTGASGIIAANSSNIKILNNKVQLACMYPDTSQNTNECITIASVATFEVAYNSVSDRITNPSNGGEGIDAKNNSTNGTIHHNTVTSLNRVGIYIDAFLGNLSNIEVYNNKIFSVISGISVASEEGGVVDGVKIHDNLIYDIDRCGIRIAGYLQDGPLRNLDVYQNTVVNCGLNAGTWENVGLLIEAKNVTNTGFNFRNNIISGCPYQVRANNQTFPYVLDNNILFGATVVSGTNRIAADPIFKNPASKDFSLSVGSPAINMAVGTPLSTKDFTDFTRDSNPDIGAFEYR
ncbi:MAG: right-handed parallel beta-helix repeat-containing protein [Flavobacterium sp.]|nr:right-handed parallel beta-helix repeat-containing protein [Flavobacterium sp.]